MRRTNIYLDDTQLSALDEIAKVRGTSRADVVRDFIERGLSAQLGSVEGDLLAIDESFGILRHSELESERGTGERERHLDRIRSA